MEICDIRYKYHQRLSRFKKQRSKYPEFYHKYKMYSLVIKNLEDVINDLK